MSIYIITSKYFIENKLNLYKIGKTDGTQKDLLTTYSRGLGNPQIIKFYSRNEIYNNTIIENLIKDILVEYRIKSDHSDMKQEWVDIPLNKLVIEIESIIKNVNDYVLYDTKHKIINNLLKHYPRTELSFYSCASFDQQDRILDKDYVKTLNEYELSSICLLRNLDTKGSWIEMYNRIFKI